MASIEELAAIHQKFKELETYVLQLIERAERQSTSFPAATAVARPQPRLEDIPDVAQPIPARIRRPYTGTRETLPGVGSDPRDMSRDAPRR